MIIKIHLFKTPLLLCNVSVAPRSKLINQLLILLIPLILISCRERVVPPPDKPPYIPPIVLTAEDVGVTDAFIRLKFLDTANTSPKTFILTRDGKALMTNTIISNDTLLFDEGLLPKRTYKYIAYRLINNVSVDSSSPLFVTSMDTSSGNWVFQIDTLGDGSSSVLRDIAIINDTCVWAVGEIYKKDSLGNWEPEMYNIAKWNGKEWKLTKAYFEYRGRPYVTQLYAIYAFSENDIWVGTGGPYHWNGNKWTASNIGSAFSGRVNKFWGTSSSNLFMVGTNGSIAHFNGTSWRRLESGTDQTINDVWGVNDPETSEPFTLAGASNVYNPGYIKLLQIKASGFVDTIPWISQDRRISSVWFQNKNRLFTAGGGVFRRSPVGIWKEFKEIPLIYTSRIRGQDINDIFVAGDFGIVAHWNGMNWRLYPEVAAALYYSCDYKNNLMVAVGERNRRAISLIMRE